MPDNSLFEQVNEQNEHSQSDGQVESHEIGDFCCYPVIVMAYNTVLNNKSKCSFSFIQLPNYKIKFSII